MKAVIFYIFETKDDVEGDYHNSALVIDKTFIKDFGDYYHDKGHLCANAFAEGFASALKKEIHIEKKDLVVKNPMDTDEIIKKLKQTKEIN